MSIETPKAKFGILLTMTLVYAGCGSFLILDSIGIDEGPNQKSYAAMTSNGDTALTFHLYKLSFLNFLLGKQPNGQTGIFFIKAIEYHGICQVRGSSCSGGWSGGSGRFGCWGRAGSPGPGASQSWSELSRLPSRSCSSFINQPLLDNVLTEGFVELTLSSKTQLWRFKEFFS